MYATKRMEGNLATGCILLAKYSRVVLELDHLVNACKDLDLKAMLELMRNKMEGYQSEAVACDAIVISTILNPRFRIHFFDLNYPEEAVRAKNIFRQTFEKALEDLPEDPISTSDEVTQSPSISTSPTANCTQFDVFTTQLTAQSPANKCQEEQADYIEGAHLMLAGQSELDWWKVCSSFLAQSLIYNFTDLFYY